MFTKEKLSVRTRIRRWWKCYKSEYRWKGYIVPLLEDFMPGYYKLNRLYWAIRHRTTDQYHKIDTKLDPGYYDIDSLLVYGCFALLERYIDDEYRGLDHAKSHVEELMRYKEEDNKDMPPEHVEDSKKAYDRQANSLREAIRLYEWWKNEYPTYDKNDPWDLHYDEIHKAPRKPFDMRTKPCAWDKDGDPTLFELIDNDTPDQRDATRKLIEESHVYKTKCEETITNNLIALIRMRETLWT